MQKKKKKKNIKTIEEKGKQKGAEQLTPPYQVIISSDRKRVPRKGRSKKSKSKKGVLSGEEAKEGGRDKRKGRKLKKRGEKTTTKFKHHVFHLRH